MNRVSEFLKEHKLRASDTDIGNLIKIFTEDMLKGLQGKDGALRMIPTYIEAENDFLREVPVLAIDAGGTNFRASLIRFRNTGEVEISDIISYRMPGLDKEISAKDFFRTIAGYVEPLVKKAERIGFCFSYPSEILPDRDGRLIRFCKEVRAPEVEGMLIGKSLLEAMGIPGRPIVLLNDTVATLLAGKSVSVSKDYDTFMGYILGTGTNTCYIERNINITKKKDLNPEMSQIINIESGDFKNAPRTDLDIIFDNSTVDPGNYMFEKMFSGGYFGGLCLTVLKAAGREGVLTEETGERLSGLNNLSTNEVNEFVINPFSETNLLCGLIRDKKDKDNCSEIVNSLIGRAAKLVAANLAAVILHTGKGMSENRPVLITVEGTTFNKMYNLQKEFKGYFDNYLIGQRKRYVEFTGVPQSGLVGAALAALIL